MASGGKEGQGSSKRKEEETKSQSDFFLRYYVGHQGKFGHEFLEFELNPEGRLRYANNSNYKNEKMIRKQVFVSRVVHEEFQRIIEESEIMKEDDAAWPKPDKVGRQELEVVLGNAHVSFSTTKLGSLREVEKSKDPEGLRKLYYLAQDIKIFVHSLLRMHFKINPLG